ERRRVRLLLAVRVRHRHEAPRRIDLAVRAGDLELAAGTITPDVAPSAAGAEVDLADRHREAIGAGVPVREMLGIGEGRPDDRTRRVEGARDHELAIGRCAVQGLVRRGGWLAWSARLTWPRHRSTPPP